MSTFSNSVPSQAGFTVTVLRKVGGAVKLGWIAYLEWRVQRLAIRQLQLLSDRELKDIGISRDAIVPAVKVGRETLPIFRHY